MLDIAEQLADKLPARYAIDHPMERHQEAITRFGQPDGTLKIYDLPMPADKNKYREQAETNEMFDSHNDGLGPCASDDLPTRAGPQPDIRNEPHHDPRESSPRGLVKIAHSSSRRCRCCTQVKGSIHLTGRAVPRP